jgi:hypothetical protein
LATGRSWETKPCHGFLGFGYIGSRLNTAGSKIEALEG